MSHTHDVLPPFGLPVPGRKATRFAAVRQRIEAWLAARAKSVQDASDLSTMSDRELRDIGIDPASVPRTAWNRDW
jgi:uncharacterized protein YjiS (DUF1127 family)